VKQRSAKDGPWAWFNKAAIEKIRTRCEDPKSSLAVYFALVEIASDEQSDDFTVSMQKIASKCCLSRRTVFDRLNDLERIGLIDVYHSKTSEQFRIPSAYKLLRCETVAHRCATTAQRCANEVSGGLHTLKESKE
jgi:predicted transcriptional regulator